MNVCQYHNLYVFYCRYYFSGDKEGTVEIFSENLPCWPDNISPSNSGGYWVGCCVIRNPDLDYFFSRLVFMRSVFSKVCIHIIYCTNGKDAIMHIV